MKSINIIEEYTNYIKKKLKEIAKLILGKKYSEEIFSYLLEIYIKVRYYDLLDRKSKKPYSNVKLYIKDEIVKLKKENKEIDAVLDIYSEIFNFEQSNLRVNNFLNNIQEYLDELKIDKNMFKNKLNKIYEEINNKRKEIKKALATKDFVCNYKSTNINKTYIVNMDYTFSVPKLYSDYAVQNVYYNGRINEDKLYIEYYLVIYKLLTDILNFDFSNNYIMEFADSLFEKDGKLNRFLSIISNDLCKEKMSLKISFDTFTKYKEKVLKLVNSGYSFAILIDDSYVDSVENKKIIASVFKYIIINSSNKNINIFDEYTNLIKIK